MRPKKQRPPAYTASGLLILMCSATSELQEVCERTTLRKHRVVHTIQACGYIIHDGYKAGIFKR
jgi:hypothetical protein